MNIEQFRYASDNFSYLAFKNDAAFAIDGGAVDEIIRFLNTNQLKLKFATNTHSHPDHTSGTDRLLKRTGAGFLSCGDARKKGTIEFEGETISVLHTPGHTEDSVCFYFRPYLVSGDTLFNGTVGNCFSGDLKGFLKSLKTLIALPADTVILAGHDYVRESLAFAKKLEPGNPYIDRFLSEYNSKRVQSTLEQELRINPYLKFNDDHMISIMREKGFQMETEWDRWKSLMSIE